MKLYSLTYYRVLGKYLWRNDTSGGLNILNSSNLI